MVPPEPAFFFPTGEGLPTTLGEGEAGKWGSQGGGTPHAPIRTQPTCSQRLRSPACGPRGRSQVAFWPFQTRREGLFWRQACCQATLPTLRLPGASQGGTRGSALPQPGDMLFNSSWQPVVGVTAEELKGAIREHMDPTDPVHERGPVEAIDGGVMGSKGVHMG